MFSLKWKTEKVSQLDPVIAKLIEDMEPGWSAEEYPAQAEALKTLLEARALEPQPKKLDVNTVIVVAGNLAGIILILLFERGGVITSKAVNFVFKPKT